MWQMPVEDRDASVLTQVSRTDDDWRETHTCWFRVHVVPRKAYYVSLSGDDGPRRVYWSTCEVC